MIYFILFIQFFQIGLFAVGGGLATIPFLFALSKEFGWFTAEDITNMIAIAESTPGPIGINMATFAGIKTAGILGGIISTFSLVLPGFLLIVFVSKSMKFFKKSHFFEAALYGFRPAVSIMILIFFVTLMQINATEAIDEKRFFVTGFLFLCYLILCFRFKSHPIFFIFVGAVMGMLLQL